jgi:hypothetical protein
VLFGVAVVAGLTLAYNKIKPFKDFVDGIVDSVKSLLGFGGSTLSASGAGGANASTLGPSLGVAKTVDASLRTPPAQENKSVVEVNFQNLPKGARVEATKSDAPLDLFMGYSMAGP